LRISCDCAIIVRCQRITASGDRSTEGGQRFVLIDRDSDTDTDIGQFTGRTAWHRRGDAGAQCAEIAGIARMGGHCASREAATEDDECRMGSDIDSHRSGYMQFALGLSLSLLLARDLGNAKDRGIVSILGSRVLRIDVFINAVLGFTEVGGVCWADVLGMQGIGRSRGTGQRTDHQFTAVILTIGKGLQLFQQQVLRAVQGRAYIAQLAEGIEVTLDVRTHGGGQGMGLISGVRQGIDLGRSVDGGLAQEAGGHVRIDQVDRRGCAYCGCAAGIALGIGQRAACEVGQLIVVQPQAVTDVNGIIPSRSDPGRAGNQSIDKMMRQIERDRGIHRNIGGCRLSRGVANFHHIRIGRFRVRSGEDFILAGDGVSTCDCDGFDIVPEQGFERQAATCDPAVQANQRLDRDLAHAHCKGGPDTRPAACASSWRGGRRGGRRWWWRSGRRRIGGFLLFALGSHTEVSR